MTQWEVYKINLPVIGPHPVVIISGNGVCADLRIKTVNGLLCSTIRAGDSVAASEVGLDQADGLETLTGCQCHSFLILGRARFDGVSPMGVVSSVRRAKIKSKIKDWFDLH